MLYHTMACCSFWKMPCPKCRSSTSSQHTQKEIHRGHFFQDWSLSNIWVILQDGAEFCAVFITKKHFVWIEYLQLDILHCKCPIGRYHFVLFHTMVFRPSGSVHWPMCNCCTPFHHIQKEIHMGRPFHSHLSSNRFLWMINDD